VRGLCPVHGVVLAVHLHQRSLRVRADVGDDAAQAVDSLRVKHTATIFCYEDKTRAQFETQCWPRRMSVSLSIGQPYHRFVKRWQAFKFELRPNGAQRRQMRCFAGSCRFVYNKGLALQNARFDAGEKKLSYGELCKLLTQWRSNVETSWLKDAPIHPLQQALKDLERAYANFFAQRSDLPRFKKKGQHERFRYPDSKEIKLDPMNSRLFLPKLGWVRHRNSRTVLGKIKNLTVSLSCGKWFVSVQTEREVEQPLPRGGARRDYLHKTSTAISQNHAMVCIEDLQVRNMSRSASGSTETPGKRVRAKSGLNKSILDQGWFEFRRQERRRNPAPSGAEGCHSLITNCPSGGGRISHVPPWLTI